MNFVHQVILIKLFFVVEVIRQWHQVQSFSSSQSNSYQITHETDTVAKYSEWWIRDTIVMSDCREWIDCCIVIMMKYYGFYCSLFDSVSFGFRILKNWCVCSKSWESLDMILVAIVNSHRSVNFFCHVAKVLLTNALLYDRLKTYLISMMWGVPARRQFFLHLFPSQMLCDSKSILLFALLLCHCQ